MNDNIKKVLQGSVFAGFVAIVLIFGAKVNYASAENINRDQSLAISMVNDYRSSHGMEQLKWNDKLAEAALDKANDMNEQKYFDHTSPNGTKAWDFILKENYQYNSAGENLAIDFDTVSDATIAWEKSPSHLKNITSGSFTDFGFAQINANIEGRPTVVFVQIFASEKPLYDRVLDNITK